MIEIKLAEDEVIVCGHSLLSKEPCARVTGYLDCFEMTFKRIAKVERSHGYTKIKLVKETVENAELFMLFKMGLVQLASFYPRSITTRGINNVLP